MKFSGVFPVLLHLYSSSLLSCTFSSSVVVNTLNCAAAFQVGEDKAEIFPGVSAGSRPSAPDSCRSTGSHSVPGSTNNMDVEADEYVCSTNSEQTSKSSNSLVVYNPTHLEPFRLTSRTFHFARREFLIRQNWADLGVAAVVWDAAVVLCEYLESQCKTGDLTLDDMRVIELGAGIGLVGMVAAALNGAVTVTDLDSVLGSLEENINLNFPPTSSSSSSPSSSPTSSPTSSSLQSAMRPTVQALNWGKDHEKFPATFDLILGADIIYLEDTFPDLLQTLVHLSGKDSVVLLSCRIRYERDERFLEMMRQEFSVTEVRQDAERGIVVYSARKVSS